MKNYRINKNPVPIKATLTTQMGVANNTGNGLKNQRNLLQNNAINSIYQTTNFNTNSNNTNRNLLENKTPIVTRPTSKINVFRMQKKPSEQSGALQDKQGPEKNESLIKSSLGNSSQKINTLEIIKNNSAVQSKTSPRTTIRNESAEPIFGGNQPRENAFSQLFGSGGTARREEEQAQVQTIFKKLEKPPSPMIRNDIKKPLQQIPQETQNTANKKINLMDFQTEKRPSQLMENNSTLNNMNLQNSSNFNQGFVNGNGSNLINGNNSTNFSSNNNPNNINRNSSNLKEPEEEKQQDVNIDWLLGNSSYIKKTTTTNNTTIISNVNGARRPIMIRHSNQTHKFEGDAFQNPFQGCQKQDLSFQVPDEDDEEIKQKYQRRDQTNKNKNASNTPINNPSRIIQTSSEIQPPHIPQRLRKMLDQREKIDQSKNRFQSSSSSQSERDQRRQKTGNDNIFQHDTGNSQKQEQTNLLNSQASSSTIKKTRQDSPKRTHIEEPRKREETNNSNLRNREEEKQREEPTNGINRSTTFTIRSSNSYLNNGRSPPPRQSNRVFVGRSPAPRGENTQASSPPAPSSYNPSGDIRNLVNFFSRLNQSNNPHTHNPFHNQNSENSDNDEEFLNRGSGLGGSSDTRTNRNNRFTFQANNIFGAPEMNHLGMHIVMARITERLDDLTDLASNLNRLQRLVVDLRTLQGMRNGGGLSEGLTKEQIEAIPIIKMKQQDNDEETPCPICMEDINSGDEVKILTCLHKFHPGCISDWLATQPLCPNCKANQKAYFSPINDSEFGGEARGTGDTHIIDDSHINDDL